MAEEKLSVQLNAIAIDNNEEFLKFIGKNLDLLQNGIVTLHLSGKKQSQNIQTLEDLIKKQNSIIEKQTKLFEEAVESGIGGNSSGDSISSLSDSDLLLKMKSLLLEDDDILEHFDKVLENTHNYNERKKNVDSYIDNKNSKKKKKRIIPISFIAFFVISVMIVISYFFVADTPNLKLKAGDIFYKKGNLKELSFEIDTTVDITKEDIRYYYFKFNEEIYMVEK